MLPLPETTMHQTDYGVVPVNARNNLRYEAVFIETFDFYRHKLLCYGHCWCPRTISILFST